MAIIKITLEMLIGFDDVLIARYIHSCHATIRDQIQMMIEHATELALVLVHHESS